VSQTVLIYRLGSLGDMVVALPCFHLIARKFPNARRILLTNAPVHAKAPAAASVLGESGLVHDYLAYPVGTRKLSALVKLWFTIRRLRPATLVYLAAPRGDAATRRDSRFFKLSGVRDIIGLPLHDLGTNLFNFDTEQYEAEASRLGRCLAPLGDPSFNDRASWNLLLTRAEKDKASEVLRPLKGSRILAFGIGSNRSTTDWGVDNWKALMPKLHRAFPAHSIVFIGAPDDRPASDAVGRNWPGAFLNLCGFLSPRQSAAVIEHGDLFLGPDSGPMHLAASVGTSCVSIFSARNRPGVWFPYGENHSVLYRQTECGGCNLDVCTIEKKKCILSISADDVVKAAVRGASSKAQTIALRM
jgi:heptosyltransferase-3